MVVNAQEEYDQVESKARVHKSAKEVGKTRQVRTNFQPATTSFCATPQPAQKPILKKNT